MSNTQAQVHATDAQVLAGSPDMVAAPAMTLEEALALLDATRAEAAAKDAEIARLAAAVPAAAAAFVPQVTCIMRPIGYSERGDGTFALQQPKLEVAVTRRSGKPAIVRENLAVWTAILGASDAIAEALKGA